MTVSFRVDLASTVALSSRYFRLSGTQRLNDTSFSMFMISIHREILIYFVVVGVIHVNSKWI